jgi:hypothetical protein
MKRFLGIVITWAPRDVLIAGFASSSSGQVDVFLLGVDEWDSVTLLRY